MDSKYEKPLLILAGGLITLATIYGAQNLDNLGLKLGKNLPYSAENESLNIKDARGIQVNNEDNTTQKVEIRVSTISENELIYHNNVKVKPGETKQFNGIIRKKGLYHLTASTSERSQTFKWKIGERFGDGVINVREGIPHTRQEIL